MEVFLNTQLDFILFFYGLAFVLLGTVCLGIARSGRQDVPWILLSSFAFAHGGGEWLDLVALVVGDTLEFAVGRTVLMACSFALLLEFARLEAVRRGLKVPGRWIHAPLALLVLLVGIASGLTEANALARYIFGLTGALATGIVLALHAKGVPRSERRWIVFAVLGFAFYGVAAGVVVPATSFWPATIINYNSFISVTGMPIQFVRGLLACWVAFSIWGFWGQKLSRDVGSQRYTKFLQRQFVWTLVAMATILAFGWVTTEYLGGIYKQNIQSEARGDLDLLASRLDGETAAVDGLARALAGAQSVQSFLINKQESERVRSALSTDVDASAAERGFILDHAGEVIASFNSDATEVAGEHNYSSSPFFLKSAAGEAGRYFAFDALTGKTNYYASYPVRIGTGEIAGVAVLSKSLDAFNADLSRFDRTFFLVDPHGVVVLTNRPGMLFRMLWPSPAGSRVTSSFQVKALNDAPMLEREVVDATWVTVGGQRDYVRRRLVSHSDWSLITLTVPRGIFASRILGIILTFQMTTLALAYLVGRERSIHDNVQTDKRQRLEELARASDLRAATDPLTGLYNRRRFNQELALEVLRSQRYRTPLSLVLYDVDYFKRINDTYGHQIGDSVLIELSQFVDAHIRNVDVHARWGGEEFAILVPGSSLKMAGQLADKLRYNMQSLVFRESTTITCSFGVAEFEIEDTTETLIARADAALYRAKFNGRNRVELGSRSAVEENIGLQTVA